MSIQEDKFDDLINEIKSCITSFEKIYDEYTNNYGQTRIDEVSNYIIKNRLTYGRKTYIEIHLHYLIDRNYKVLDKFFEVNKNLDLIVTNHQINKQFITDMHKKLIDLQHKNMNYENIFIKNEYVSNAARKLLQIYRDIIVTCG